MDKDKKLPYSQDKNARHPFFCQKYSTYHNRQTPDGIIHCYIQKIIGLPEVSEIITYYPNQTMNQEIFTEKVSNYG